MGLKTTTNKIHSKGHVTNSSSRTKQRICFYEIIRVHREDFTLIYNIDKKLKNKKHMHYTYIPV